MKFIVLIPLLILVGCKPTANENLIKFDIDQSFDVSGTFSHENSSYIYFVKRKFNPSVIIFNEKGIKLDSISLNKAEQELSEITNVWMGTPDSIFVYSYYINTMVILDNKGEIRGIRKMNGVEDETGQVYEFYPPYGNIESTENIIFTACILKKYGDKDYGSWESLSEYSKNMKDGYLIYKKSINENPVYDRFGLKKSELEEFLNRDSILFLPFWQTTVANNKYIFNSKYSRYIYLLDKDLSVNRTVKIIPDNIKIMQPVELNEDVGISDEITLFSDLQNQTGCAINHIFYDENKHNYIISVLDYDINTNNYFPYKFYVYNSHFKKISEVDIDNKEKYNGKNCFYLNPYVLIERVNNNDEKKRVFEVFKI